MAKNSQQTPTTTTATLTPALQATPGTPAAENSAASAQEQGAGDTDQQPVAPAIVDNYGRVSTDGFHESHGRACCCFKGGIVELIKAAAEVRQFQVALGDRFYDFARCRLGLTPTMADFLVRVAELGIDPAQFSPAIEVKMAAAMETVAWIVDAWAAVTSGMTPAAICDLRPRRVFRGTIILLGADHHFTIDAEDFSKNGKLMAAIYGAAGAKAEIHCKPEMLRTAVSAVSGPANMAARRV